MKMRTGISNDTWTLRLMLRPNNSRNIELSPGPRRQVLPGECRFLQEQPELAKIDRV